MAKPGVFKTIQDTDSTITSFKVYKSWGYQDSASLDSDNIDRIVAIKPNKDLYTGNKVTLNTVQTNADSASYLVNISNNQTASVMWYSLNHLYYQRVNKPYDTFGSIDDFESKRRLYNEASIISVPQRKFGETIKPESVRLNLIAPALHSTTMSLEDDGHGNLIDTALSESISNQVVYLGFNDYDYDDIWTDNLTTSLTSRDGIDEIKKFDSIIPELNISSKNVWMYPGSVPTTSSYIWGNSAHFNGTSYIRIPNSEFVNFRRTDDFAISFWIKPFFTTNTANSYILSKKTTGTGDVLNKRLVQTQDVEYNSTQFAFEVQYNPILSRIYALQSNGSETITLQGLNVNINTSNHILVQQSGSSFQLYVNGTLASVQNGVITSGNIHNQADIVIGSLGLDLSTKLGRQGFEGAIDEFLIFSKALTSAEINQLSSVNSLDLMVTNNNAVGNVFYGHGMVVISDPRPKYGTATVKLFNDRLYNTITQVSQSSTLSSFEFSYNSTITLYEHEYLCRIKQDEFNFTANPTIRQNNDANSELPKAFVANDEFSPYITTIGLYNKLGELVAIGKLSNPIKKRDDADLSIIVRFDT
jgi:hypothetical protein